MRRILLSLLLITTLAFGNNISIFAAEPQEAVSADETDSIEVNEEDFDSADQSMDLYNSEDAENVDSYIPGVAESISEPTSEATSEPDPDPEPEEETVIGAEEESESFSALMEQDGSGEPAEEIIASGSCGESASWELNSDYSLIIKGTGETGFYQSSTNVNQAPWKDYANDIKNVEVQEGITNIGTRAFFACTAVETVSLPASLKTIGDEAFSGCINLWYVNFPESLEKICYHAFDGCALKNVDIPSGKIGHQAFANNTDLAQVVFGAGVTEISAVTGGSSDSVKNSFKGCTSLHSIDVSSDNEFLSSVDGVLFDKTGESLLRYPQGRAETAYDVPVGVVYIAEYAFSDCALLKEVSFPETLTDIGRYAFYGCTGILSLVIPDSVTKIEGSAFLGCTSLSSVKIPEGTSSIIGMTFAGCSNLSEIVLPRSLKTIGVFAFIDCSLESVTIPANVTEIGRAAFACRTLRNVYFRGHAPSMDESLFRGSGDGAERRIYYPEDDETWTDDVKASLTGEYEWIPYTPEYLPVDFWGVSLSNENNLVYNGKEQRPNVSVSEGTSLLEEGRDYSLSFANNVYPGEATVVISGCGEYRGEVSKKYIVKKGTIKATVRSYSGRWDGNAHSIPNPIVSTATSENTQIYYSTSEALTEENYLSAGSTEKPSRTEPGTTQVYYYIVDEHGYCNPVSGSVLIEIVKEEQEQPTEVIAEGACGESVSWQLTNKGTLTVSGSGPMDDYASPEEVPWYQEYVEKYADETAGAITEVVVEDGITSLGDYDFYNCRHITNLSVPDSVQRIGVRCFANCTGLPEMVLNGNTVIKLGDYAFESCTALETVDLGQAAQWPELGKYVFKDCRNLKSLILYRSDIMDSDDCYTWFVGCTSLQSISWHNDFGSMWGSYKVIGNNFYRWSQNSQDGILYKKCYLIKHLPGLNQTSSGSSEMVPVIGAYSFYDSDSLEELNFHDDARIYGDSFAQNCDNLRSVTLSKRAETIGSLAFAECPKLETITIPGCVQSIGTNAFRGCNGLKSIYFRGDVPSVGDGIFSSDMTLTAYYPDANPTWTEEARSGFGGNVTWISYKPEDFTSFSDENYFADVKTNSFVYDGEAKELAVGQVKQRNSANSETLRNYPLTEGANYSISYEDNNIAGMAKLVISGCGEYSGRIEQAFVIQPKVTANSDAGVYDGRKHTLDITAEGGATLYFSEYEPLTFENYRDSGTTDIPSRTMAGTSKVYYIAVPDKNPSEASCVAGETELTVEPGNQSLTAEISASSLMVGDTVQILASSGAGSISYASENENVVTVDSNGTVTGVSEGKTRIIVSAAATANYQAEEKIFEITVTPVQEISISDCTVEVDSVVYTGEPLEPKVTIQYNNRTLVPEKDYTLKYSNNTDVGRGMVTITGAGNFIGSVIKSFVIEEASTPEPKSIDSCFVTLSETSYTYNGEIQKPKVTVKDGDMELAEGTDFTVTCDPAVNAGRYELAIEGKGNYSGVKTLTFEILPAKPALGIEQLSYSFGNTASSFGYPTKRSFPFSLNIYELIFGRTSKAEFWHSFDPKVTGGVWKGNCAGFSGTAALLADPESGISVTDFETSASAISQLTPESVSSGHRVYNHQMSVTDFIEAMQVSQDTQLFQNSLAQNRVYTAKHLRRNVKNLNALYQTVSSETKEGRPVVLGLFQNNSGHAVLAYGVQDISETESKILLYDNNWPGEERSLTLKKNTDGNYTEWSYEIGRSYGVWGSNTSSSSISYVPYRVIKEIWTTKGNLKENENVLELNSGSVAIYNSSDKPVATVTQGELSTTDDDIRVIEHLQLEKAEDESILLSVPVGVYTFDNLDKSVQDFEVTMTNTNLGAAVSTTANSVTVAVDDSCNLNAVYIDAAEGDQYSVTLNSSFSYDDDNVVVTGLGTGATMEVSQTRGNININNCSITSISIDGREIGKYTLKASAGAGGSITPAGDNVVTEGESVQYKIVPNTHYMISDVLVDGKSVGAVKTYSFNDVSANHTIKAVFKKKSANTITAHDYTLTSTASARSFTIKTAVKGNAKLKYSSNNASVKVLQTGKVTIAKNYVGKATIKITSAETAVYLAASKSITIIINPTGVAIAGLKRAGSGKMTVSWKKNNYVAGYQISFGTSSNFKNATLATYKKKTILKATLKKLKKKKYYVRMRTYKVVGGRNYYSAWSKTKTIIIK